MFKTPRRLQVPIHLRREMVTLAMLTGLAAVLLIGVTALSEMFHAQQEALADRWSSRGDADLAKENYKAAAEDYQAALRYTRAGYVQQLGLAEALIGQQKIDEARVYLQTLWEQQPENGIVNRELARIAAGKGDTRTALRYYHNAIYANWQGRAETERVATRWELIKYLLNIKAQAQAQAELIGLGAEVGENPEQQLSLGKYFLKVQDGDHALAAFRLCLRANPHDAAALAGAGEAEFDLGNYARAQRDLTEAVTRDPEDRDSASLLEVTAQVVRLNPFRRGITDSERDEAVWSAFQAAGERLKACTGLANEPATPVTTPAAQSAVSAGKTPSVLGTIAAALGKIPVGKKKAQGAAAAPQAAAKQQPQNPAAVAAQGPTLGAAWAQLEPKITVREVRHNQDVVNQAMNLAFNIERQAASKCGPGRPADTALLLISRLHEGS